MRAHSGLRRVVELLAGSSLWLLAACQSPGSERIVGPDGSPMAHVHCGSEQGQCFRIAGELCPHGYELKPVLSGSDGNFLVRCRNAGPATAAVAPACPAAVPSAAPAVAATVTRTPGPNRDKWPPSAEPSTPYPWPAAQTSAAARSQPGTPAAQGDVDIGY